MARLRGSKEADQGDLERGFTAAARSLLRILSQRGRYFRMLASIDVPVLLLHGDKDRLVSVAAARDAARRNPDWTYVEFGGVGHTPQLEVPDEVIPVVDGWLAEVHA
jgi:pimeloyl-ACP methyl ester carboxylesterase